MRYCCKSPLPVSKEGFGFLCERCGTLLDEHGFQPRHKAEPLKANPLLALGRNELCLCGSGKKFKHCCLRAVNELKASRRQAAFRQLREASAL